MENALDNPNQSSVLEDQTADLPSKVVRLVDQLTTVIRNVALKPIGKIAGIVLASIGIMFLAPIILILGIIGVIRVLDTYAFASHTWISEGLIGVIFIVLGIIFLAKRK